MLSEHTSFSPYSPGAGRLCQQASVELEQTSSIDHHRDAERPSRQASVELEQTSSIDHHRDAERPSRQALIKVEQTSIQRHRSVGHLSGAPTSGLAGVPGVHGHWVQAHPLTSSTMERLWLPNFPSFLG